MKKLFQKTLLPLYDLFFPKLCPGCKQEVLNTNKLLCWSCLLTLPETHFDPKDNPLFEKFPKTLPLHSLFALFIFYPKGIVENLLYTIKYEQHPELGSFLGQQLGHYIQAFFSDIKGVIPVPLHPKRERLRGYNQAEKIAEGMAEILGCKVYNALIRTKNTPQLAHTKKDRDVVLMDAFSLSPTEKLPKGHYFLIDDILTTGATLRACAKVLLNEEKIYLSMATLAYRV